MPAMRAAFGFLAVQRETAMIIALATLSVAGAIFAIGAFLLYARERRASRRAKAVRPPA
jgi:hypothetical protein